VDTQNLQAFLAVARSESFSHAADALHLTQPAVSKRIGLLEQQLDTRLFDRVGRQVSLTEAGRTLLPRATHILEAIAQARQEIKDLSVEVKGDLRLVTSHHIGLHRLPSVLRIFSRRFPKVNLDIQFLDSRSAYEKILSGTFDLGIVTQAAIGDSKIFSETIWTDKLVFVAARSHPLSKHQTLELQDVSNYPALLPESKFYTTQIVENLFQKKGLKLNILMSTNYLETIKALITAGYAWGVLPEIMLTDKALMQLPVKSPPLIRQLDCIYHQDRTLSNPAKFMLAVLREL
jgi:DNA-binding transcriptional LysR family regulator